MTETTLGLFILKLLIFSLITWLIIFLLRYFMKPKLSLSTFPQLGNPMKQTLRLPLLIVTAHPDDESMFFAPTILFIQREVNRLLHEEFGDDYNQWISSGAENIFVLCLSNGDHDGLGDIRKDEFIGACLRMGLWEERVFVLDKFKDGPNERWDESEIARTVAMYVQRGDIQSVVSFDGYGVSGHPNHISIGRAVAKLRKSLSSSSRKPRFADVYELRSVPLWRKYLGIFDCYVVALKILKQLLYRFLYTLTLTRNVAPRSPTPPPESPQSDSQDSKLRRRKQSKRKATSPTRQQAPKLPESKSWLLEPLRVIYILSRPVDYIDACIAMAEHQSQLVWFRWLYILFSRYMYINELYRVEE